MIADAFVGACLLVLFLALFSDDLVKIIRAWRKP